MMAEWVERWIDEWVRGNSYPPQLRSNDFYSLLEKYFGSARVLDVLEQIRQSYRHSFLRDQEVDDLAWLPQLLRADAEVVSFLPLQYLN